jgi:hypothetical protein
LIAFLEDDGVAEFVGFFEFAAPVGFAWCLLVLRFEKAKRRKGWERVENMGGEDGWKGRRERGGIRRGKLTARIIILLLAPLKTRSSLSVF